MTTTPEQRTKLKAAAEAATPGSWETKRMEADRSAVARRLYVCGPSEVIGDLDGVCEPDRYNDRSFKEDDANMCFIALANPSTILALLAEIESLEARVASAEGALQAIADGHGGAPNVLGQRMMDRPGAADHRNGHPYKSQGYGRMGGAMMSRLSKMGLVFASGWPTRAVLTEAGRRALQDGGKADG